MNQYEKKEEIFFEEVYQQSTRLTRKLKQKFFSKPKGGSYRNYFLLNYP